MTLKVSVGLSKKVGQPNYGSLGAWCQIEIELDTQACQTQAGQSRPLLLQAKISEAFCICKASIENELALERLLQTQVPTRQPTESRQPTEPRDSSVPKAALPSCAPVAPTALVAPTAPVVPATGYDDQPGTQVVAKPIRNATQAQVRALERIASQAGVDLSSHAKRDFGVQSVDQLTIRQASLMIDRLKALLMTS